MKHILLLSIGCIAVAALACSCNSGAKKAAKAAEEAAAKAAEAEKAIVDSAKVERALVKLADLPTEPEFEIITTLGTIRIKLYSDTPKHRENFAKLALSGFYDGLLFHRVIKDFMIQGGDPLTKDEANKARFGTGGPDYTVEAEILPNHSHKKGALAAARRGDAANPMRESSGSQFYLVHGDASFLDGQYTVYGETVEGLDVIDKIAAVETDGRDCPLNPVKILVVKPVSESISTASAE